MFKFDDANLFGKDAMDSVLKSYSTAAKGLQAIAAEAADYSKRSYEAGLAHFEQLATAKSIETVFELQANYAKNALEAYVAEMTKIGEMYQAIAKDAYQPVEQTVQASVQKSATTAKANAEKAAAAAVA